MTRRGRSLLASRGGDYEFDPESMTVADEDVLDLLEPAVQGRWVNQFGEFVPSGSGSFIPSRRGAIPRIRDGDNALIYAPARSGKAFVSFMAIISELFRRKRESPDGLDNSVYRPCVSPLKSLASGIHRNLTESLSGIIDTAADRGGTVDIRHVIRYDGASSADHQRMLLETLHILNTTPETLVILLNSPRFKGELQIVKYIVVDEIRSLAENKRGTRLSVSLERLEDLVTSSPMCASYSATVEPPDMVAEFLVSREGGESRDYELMGTRLVRDFDVRLECPIDDLIQTPRSEVQSRFHGRLYNFVTSYTSMLVFTNTRSGAGCVLRNLHKGPDDIDELNSGCHHGGLSKERKQEIESKLKVGESHVVTTSTNFELDIDMLHIDLAVQVSSPKSVVAFLQRVDRAGHQLGQTVEGHVIASDRDGLVECTVMLSKAEPGFVDRMFTPENTLDVTAQQTYGVAINVTRPKLELHEALRRAYPYRSFSDDNFERLFRYLTVNYDGLEDKNVYVKVWRDANDPPDGEHHYEGYPVGEPLIGRRGRTARVIRMTNIGTIPDSFTCDVLACRADQWVGTLDEGHLDTLEKGDMFVFDGDYFVYHYRRGPKVYVDRASQWPTVPSWFSEHLPLSHDLGRELATSQVDLIDQLDAGDAPVVKSWLREFPFGENSVRTVTRMFDEQVRYAGPESVATPDRLAVETELGREAYCRQSYVYCTCGQRFNDGLSRLLAYHVTRRTNANVQVAVADNGFSLPMLLNRRADLVGVLRGLDPEAVEADFRTALDGTDFLRRYFRIDATRSLMILRRYKGYEKSAAQQQVSSEIPLSFVQDLNEFTVIEETYRKILENKLSLATIEDAIAVVRVDDVDMVGQWVSSPTPRAFGFAMLIVNDVALAEDESVAFRELHERVKAEINDDESDLGIDVE